MARAVLRAPAPSVKVDHLSVLEGSGLTLSEEHGGSRRGAIRYCISVLRFRAQVSTVSMSAQGVQKPNPSFFDACGRSRDVVYGILIVRTLRVFSSLEKSMVCDIFQP